MKLFSKLDDFKDFTIKVADRELKVHKFIIAARSQVFAELIKINLNTNFLELQDIPVEVFECILSFVYTDKMLETENIHEVFDAAGILKIQGLIDLIKNVWTLSIEKEKNLEVLHKILCSANKFNCEELKMKAFEEIKKHFPERNFKDEHVNQIDKLKTLINTKLMLERQFEDLDI